MTLTTRRPLRKTAALAAVALLSLTGCTLLGAGQSGENGGIGNDAPKPVTGTDVPQDLEQFFSQKVSWSGCPSDVKAKDSSAKCATVKAPVDWNSPGKGEPIELALIMVPSTGKSEGSLFTNLGGPGGSGISLVAGGATQVVDPEVLRHYDLVSWDPRGVGRSTAIQCLDDDELTEYLYFGPDGKMSDDQVEQKSKELDEHFISGCKKNTGDLFAHADTLSTVEDLNLLRAVLGNDKLNYFGFSYGTEIGQRYIEQHPDTTGRMVLDGVIDQSLTAEESNKLQNEGFDSSIKRYLSDCITKSSCPFKAKDADGALDEFNALRDKMAKNPVKTSDGRAVNTTVFDTAVAVTMYSESSWTYLTKGLSRLASGDGSEMMRFADVYNGRNEDGTYEDNNQQAFLVISGLDAGREGYPGPMLKPTKIANKAETPTLLVNTTGDPATPYANAKAARAYLGNARLVSLDAGGHIAYNQHNSCVGNAVNKYLVDGTVPNDDVMCK